jgi:peroxiredoxin
MRIGTTQFKFAILLLGCAVTRIPANMQSPTVNVTTVARAYQSPDGAFSIEVPAGWQVRNEEGSNEVTILRGNVSVSVSTEGTEAGTNVEQWLEVNKSLLRQQCPTAEIREEGKTTVAGEAGAYFSMYCPGPRLPTIVIMSTAIKNGKLYSFNVTSPSAQLAAAQPEIDKMGQSFLPGSDKPESKEAHELRVAKANAEYDRRMKLLKEDCATGKMSQADCTTKAAEIGADEARAEGTSDAKTGQVITIGPPNPEGRGEGEAVNSRKTASDVIPADARKLAPNFTLTDSKGASVRLSDYKGRVVLLDFWATWCGGCKVEIPWYMEFQKKYKDSGLSALGVSLDEDGWKSVTPYLEKNPMNYLVLVGNKDLEKLYGIEGLPMTLLIDHHGRIAASYAGMVDKDAFEREIRVLLQESAKSAK